MSRPADRRTKIELLRAAEAVFVERGFEAAKVEHITARAGVSKGAFYLHFQSKEDCWTQIIEAFLAKLAACVEPPLEASVDSVQAIRDQLARWHAHDVEILEFCWQNRGLMRTVLAGGGGASHAYLIDELAERIAKQAAAWVRHAVDVGLYRPGLDPVIVASMMSGAYDRLVRDLIKEPRRPDLEAWSRQAVDLFARGLLSVEARAVLDREVTMAATGTDGGEARAEAAAPSRPRRTRGR